MIVGGVGEEFLRKKAGEQGNRVRLYHNPRLTLQHTFTGLPHHPSLNYCKHGLDKNNLTTGITLLTIDADMYKLGCVQLIEGFPLEVVYKRITAL